MTASWPIACLPAALVAATLAGCVGPTYYADGVNGQTSFTDEPWDRAAAEAGVRAMGLIVLPSAASVVAGGSSPDAARGDRVTVTSAADGATGWHFSHRIGVETRSQEEARAMVAQARIEQEPRIRAFLSAFERASNWTADEPLAFDEIILHGD